MYFIFTFVKISDYFRLRFKSIHEKNICFIVCCVFAVQ